MSTAKDVVKSSAVIKRPFENDDNLRHIRNQAEKQRRDRLNGYISELATLVPMVKNASKPLDKVSILRLAAAHLRLDKSCLTAKRFKSDVPNLPSNLAAQLELIEKNIGGFLIAATFSGLVLFCSKCIEEFLGYQNIDVMGQYMSSFVHEKQAPYFEKKFKSILTKFHEDESTKHSVTLKLSLRQRPLPRSNEVKYKKMKMKISVHANAINNDEDDNGLEPEDSSVKKKKTSKDFGSTALVLIFVEPWKWLPKINMECCLEYKDTYFTIHGLRGEIIYSDQRISTITGYFANDVIGTSAYQFIFEPDIQIALFAQQAMFASNDGIGVIVYRLKVLGSRYIYLQSKGQLVYKENSKDINHFICCNQWLSDDEGARRLKKFHNRYAPLIEASKESTQTSPEKSPISVISDENGIQPVNSDNCAPKLVSLSDNGTRLADYDDCVVDISAKQSINNQNTNCVAETDNLVDEDSFQTAVLNACSALLSVDNGSLGANVLQNPVHPQSNLYESSLSFQPPIVNNNSVFDANGIMPLASTSSAGFTHCNQLDFRANITESLNKKMCFDPNRDFMSSTSSVNRHRLGSLQQHGDVHHMLRNKILSNPKNIPQRTGVSNNAQMQPNYANELLLNQPSYNSCQPFMNNSNYLHASASIAHQNPHFSPSTQFLPSGCGDEPHPCSTAQSQRSIVDCPQIPNHSIELIREDFAASMLGYSASNGAGQMMNQPVAQNINRIVDPLTLEAQSFIPGCHPNVDHFRNNTLFPGYRIETDRHYSDSSIPAKRQRTESIPLSTSGDSGVFDMFSLSNQYDVSSSPNDVFVSQSDRDLSQELDRFFEVLPVTSDAQIINNHLHNTMNSK